VPPPPPPLQDSQKSSQLHGSAKVASAAKMVSSLNDLKTKARDTLQAASSAAPPSENDVFQRASLPASPRQPAASRRDIVLPPPPDTDKDASMIQQRPRTSIMPGRTAPPPPPNAVQRNETPPPPPPPAEVPSSATLRSKSPRTSIMPGRTAPPPRSDADSMALGSGQSIPLMQGSSRDDWKFVLESPVSVRSNGQYAAAPQSRLAPYYEASEHASLMSIGDDDTHSMASNASLSLTQPASVFKAADLPPAPGKRQSVVQRTQV
jgi:hypothetical protein